MKSDRLVPLSHTAYRRDISVRKLSVLLAEEELTDQCAYSLIRPVTYKLEMRVFHLAKVMTLALNRKKKANFKSL